MESMNIKKYSYFFGPLALLAALRYWLKLQRKIYTAALDMKAIN